MVISKQFSYSVDSAIKTMESNFLPFPITKDILIVYNKRKTTLNTNFNVVENLYST